MSTLLNAFLSNLSTVLSTEEVERIQQYLEHFAEECLTEEEQFWMYTFGNETYILDKLGLPTWFPYYPWSANEQTRKVFINAEDYFQKTLVETWYRLDLNYEETLLVAREGCLIVEEQEEWDFLLTFSKGYIIKLLKGNTISQEELAYLVSLNRQFPSVCRDVEFQRRFLQLSKCDDILYVAGLLHREVRIASYSTKIENFVENLLPREVRIASYSTKIENFVGNPTDSIYLGVELEILYQDLNIESLYSYNKEGEIALLKKDSSIEGQGFEIVTCAMSLDYQLTYWREIIEQFGSELTPHSSCGMHVHVSRQPLSQLQIGKILVFLNEPANDWYVNEIAGRAANDYCERKPKKIEDVNCPQSRYEALNLTNDSTIEFRLFASTTCYYLIASRIEFCHALTKYCENAELTKLQWADFKEWVIQEDNPLYSHLKKWLTINS
jgi:hypothetical protein